jgi:plastocyanin
MVRFSSILFIKVICLAVLLSGCVGDTNITESAKTTPTITASATATPLMTPIPELTSSGIITQVKLDGVIGFIPNTQTIKDGDQIVWENFDPLTITLLSNDGLFEAQLLTFYQQYRYVFSKPGTYIFSLKNTNLTGTIIVESSTNITSTEVVESPANQTPTPSFTTLRELPPNALYVTARMKKPSDWTAGNETKYRLDKLIVIVKSQINIPITIKIHILSGGLILEEKTFTLEKQGSSFEFSNDKIHFINNTNVNLSLQIQDYLPIEYKFVEVDQLN